MTTIGTMKRTPIKLGELFDKHSCLWPDRVLERIDSVLRRDEVSGFSRLSDMWRGQFISLYNAIDLYSESYKGGCPPYHASNCRRSVARILGRERV